MKMRDLEVLVWTGAKTNEAVVHQQTRPCHRPTFLRLSAMNMDLYHLYHLHSTHPENGRTPPPFRLNKHLMAGVSRASGGFFRTSWDPGVAFFSRPRAVSENGRAKLQFQTEQTAPAQLKLKDQNIPTLSLSLYIYICDL